MPVVLEAELTTPGPIINANANQVQQVLTNLVPNAFESGGTNRGAVRLSVKKVSAVEIPTRHRFPGNWQPQAQTYASLAVVDAGCGIADAHIDKLFDPFFSTKFTGRGMGLAVVLGIVRAHAGVITVESEQFLGSAFRVFFPVVESVSLHPSEEAKHIRELTGGGTVLVVEDDEPVRKLAATMLTSLGFAVLTAQDGVEAVEIFQQHQGEIRCVLTDLTMPRRNGWETIAALRTLRADLPIILASGYDEATVMAGEHPERPQAILSKPYKLKDLRDALGRAIG
jgi:CheY-like chemotaxis protein